MSLSNACWEGYEAIGMKKKGKKMVPNCVPINGGVISTSNVHQRMEERSKLSGRLSNIFRRIEALQPHISSMARPVSPVSVVASNEPYLLDELVASHNIARSAFNNISPMDEVNFDRRMNLVSRVADELENKIEPEEMAIGGQGVKPKFFYINPKEELLGKGVGSSKPKIYPTSPDEITRMVYANRPPLVLRPANREPVPDPKAVQSAKYEIAMRKLKKKFESV